jgi:ribonuclease HII
MKGKSMSPTDIEERRLYGLGYRNILGIDEAGMGPLFGDVYVGVVVFPYGLDYKRLLPSLNDSKKKTPEQREILYEQIRLVAQDYAVASASVAEIDELNIYWARFLAVKRAMAKLKTQPDYLLIDGNKAVPDCQIPQLPIIKRDSKSYSIAAGSILAKVSRDAHCKALATLVHPDYDLGANKGYYSLSHIAALKKHGATEWHRAKYVKKFL